MAKIQSQYPSAGPKLVRHFASLTDGIESVLDIWEHDADWETGSGYAEDYVFDRNAAETRSAAETRAKQLLDAEEAADWSGMRHKTTRGPCSVCGAETDAMWGCATPTPRLVCASCDQHFMEKAELEQQDWLKSGKCTCCGSDSLSPRAGRRMSDQLCCACVPGPPVICE